MSRTVLLPREFKERFDGLTSLEEDVIGVLFYRGQQKGQRDYCPIESMYVAGIGAEELQPGPKGIGVVNTFLVQHPEYKIIEFRTHSKGTISKLGDDLADKFTEDEISHYEKLLARESSFIGMVVTPQDILLYAPDNPQIRVVEGFPVNADRQIQDALTQIAATLGYAPSRFQAIRKRQ